MAVIQGKFKPVHLGELAEAIKALIYCYTERVSVAEVIGVLEIVKKEVLDEQE